MKIVTVVGARPQFIKAAVVSRVIGNNSGVQEVLVHTGQHYDPQMSDIFFKEMQIPTPKYHLGVGGKAQGAMTGEMLIKIEEVLFLEKPDWVLVYGDTNSTLAGALAAAKLNIPVAHVEAGLRSFNMSMPEEVNRILTDRVAQLLFCPTEQSVRNLKREGTNTNFIRRVGDVMYDATLYYKRQSTPTSTTLSLIDKNPRFVLATVHRAENTDDRDRLKQILDGLSIISETVPVVLPLHPRTKKLIFEYGYDFGRIEVIEPVGYFDMIELLSRSECILTDSGGVQKESYFLKRPCITMRDETEWVELVEGGFNQLVGADKDRIANAFARVKNNPIQFTEDLYGDGQSGEKIIKEIVGA